jgi:pimeloyl-ACP methyl ester carboxylesterase
VEGTAVSADGVEIRYRTAGAAASPQAPAVVFIHCWGCDGSYWNGELRRFADRWRMVAVDLGGHGGSGRGREEWTIEAFGADVAAVVEALDLERVVLVGHSMGGYVMLEAAKRLGPRVVGMVAVDTLHDLEQQWNRDAAERYAAALEADFAGTVEAAMRTLFPPDADSAVVGWVVRDMAEGPAEVGVSAYRHLMDYDPAAAMDTLAAPLVAVDSAMRPVAVEINRHHAPGFDATVLEGVGHWPMFETPDAFDAALAERIEQLTAAAAVSSGGGR